MNTLGVNVLLGLKFNIFIRSYFQFEIKSNKKNPSKYCETPYVISIEL